MPVRPLVVGLCLSLVALGGPAREAVAQARGNAGGGMDPDEAAMHEFVLTADKCERYAAAAKKIEAFQTSPPDPATAGEMQKVQEANVYNVQKAEMMEKSPHLAALFKTLNITPREFVLVPLTIMSAGVAAEYPAQAAAKLSYVTPAQIQFLKDHQADLEKWGLK
ncbi:MAG: hypothetical protein ACRD1V_03375 [Vicinamibacterales bacterium]